jgi:hypothetical protein
MQSARAVRCIAADGGETARFALGTLTGPRHPQPAPNTITPRPSRPCARSANAWGASSIE